MREEECVALIQGCIKMIRQMKDDIRQGILELEEKRKTLVRQKELLEKITSNQAHLQ